VPLRKSALIALSLNCGSQQLNDFTLVKYELVAAQVPEATKLRRLFAHHLVPEPK
jgi:hypothetical protein